MGYAVEWGRPCSGPCSRRAPPMRCSYRCHQRPRRLASRSSLPSDEQATSGSHRRDEEYVKYAVIAAGIGASIQACKILGAAVATIRQSASSSPPSLSRQQTPATAQLSTTVVSSPPPPLGPQWLAAIEGIPLLVSVGLIIARIKLSQKSGSADGDIDLLPASRAQATDAEAAEYVKDVREELKRQARSMEVLRRQVSRLGLQTRWSRREVSEKLEEVEVRLAEIVGKELPPVVRSARKVETLYTELELLQKSAQALEEVVAKQTGILVALLDQLDESDPDEERQQQQQGSAHTLQSTQGL